jgi:polysaccharide pyruvyl transferase WcaK-like protein
MNIKNIAFVENYDAYELKGIFEQLDLLISMRLHASILAISSGTNVVGFTFEEWGFKNAGILKQFSMTNYSTGDDILANIDFKELPKNKSDVIYKQISSLETIILEKLKPFLSI